MAIYSVYLPPESSGKNVAENFRLLRDAKAPLALIFPPVWLIWHSLWVELAVYFAIAMAISLLAAWQPLPPVFYLSAFPGLYLLLEGNELIRRKLEREGWHFAGVVNGDNQDEAEIRFLVENNQKFNIERPKPAARTPVVSRSIMSKPAGVGLFPE